jgi:hypothetical protein
MTPTDNTPDPTRGSSLALNPQAAVMFCLLAVAQADGPVCARELALIARLVDTPETGDTNSLVLARDLLGAEDGLESGLVLVCAALDRARRAQAYALAADFVMLNAQITPEEMRLLDILAENFRLNPLTRAAIDTAAQIRLAPELEHYD